MPILLFKNLFIEDAVTILKLAYENDPSAVYISDHVVNGSMITATIKENASAGKNAGMPKFDVEIQSRRWGIPTLKGFFESYDWAMHEAATNS